MQDLPVTCFSLFPWDGKTAARNRRVCKNWRNMINRVPRLVHYIQLHSVRLDKTSHLACELPSQYSELTERAMSQGVTSLVHDSCGVNLHKVDIGRPYSPTYPLSSHIISLEGLATNFGWRGECLRYLRDKTNGDLIMVNDFYNASVYKEHAPKTCHIVERAADGLTWLEKVGFRGVFTWKFLDFPEPYTPGDEPFELPAGRDFHRGASFCLKFKFRGDWSQRVKATRLHGTRELLKARNPEEVAFAAQCAERRTRGK